MKEKNGVNIILFVFIIILFINLSCVKRSKYMVSGVLLQTDRNFSAMSQQKGMHEAFLYFMANDGVILRNNSFPDKGKDKLKEHFAGKNDSSFILTWEPLFEKISECGDIGYTYGIHTNTEKSTGKITRGTYVTIWQKQTDGSWKFVLDTGTTGLPESSEN
jgi:ketosteroid isomerase-like protein